MKRAFRLFVAALLILAVPLSVLGCGGGAKGDIVIGIYGPMTGGSAQYGQSMRNNIEMFIEKVNNDGGIKGRKIKLVIEDDEGNPSKGVAAVNKLIYKDQAVAILGGPLSTVNLAAMKESQKAEVPHIATSSGNPQITEHGNPWIFRVVTKDTIIAEVIASYAVKEAKFKRIALINDSSEYGKGGGDAVKATLSKLGVQPVATETYNVGEKDFSGQLLKIKNANPDALIIWGVYLESALISKQARQLGINAQILGGTGVNNPKFVELAGEAATGVLFASPFVPNSPEPHVQEYVKAYQAKFNAVPDMTGATGYDAAQLIVQALKEVGTDKKKIGDYLHKVKGFKGVTGTFDADQSGDFNHSAKLIRIEQGGKQTVVWIPK